MMIMSTSLTVEAIIMGSATALGLVGRLVDWRSPPWRIAKAASHPNKRSPSQGLSVVFHRSDC